MTDSYPGVRRDYGGVASATIMYLVAMAAALSAGWELLMQVVHFLQSGEWVPLPFIDWVAGVRSPAAEDLISIPVWRSSTELGDWLVAPESWLGLHSIVAWVLGWVSEPFFYLAVAFMFVGAAAHQPTWKSAPRPEPKGSNETG